MAPTLNASTPNEHLPGRVADIDESFVVAVDGSLADDATISAAHEEPGSRTTPEGATDDLGDDEDKVADDDSGEAV